ncbi:MAG: bacillithiol biosynthesis cysteine-adding enzyme BshC [Flavobacteriales bacterium]|nr:bacillithiol biosynthesis cysteine-adding enzyme BshC [Flavobacteriales bacterium]
MVRENIPLEQTGFFNRLILDLVSGKDAVKPFYGLPQTVESYNVQMQERSTFPLDRAVLVDVLSQQYETIGGAKGAVLSNINALCDDRTFTVTTGHQLNIFTGPLYFIYKILHTIRLAEELQKQYPNNRFVPVYWMATEDHDLAEISFFHLFGKKYEWNTTQTGATGRMQTTGLSDICDELDQVFASQPQGLTLVAIFREAYTQKTLAQATRHLANALFGHYGLVVVDGDNAALKSCFADAMLRDAFDGDAFKAVTATNRQLSSLDCPTQINPREINLFYLGDGVRERIVRTDTGFHVLHTELQFTDEALRSEIKAHPEKFSPNVVLRPMYQECVLPNLAYIGGAGELAYWLQLKDAFATMGFSYPVLVLRNHLLLLDGSTAKRMDGLGLLVPDLFHPVDELIRAHVIETVETDLELSTELRLVEKLYEALKGKAAEIDRTLVTALDAEFAKQQKVVEQWGDRFARGLKKKNETSVQQLQKLHEKLFPNGSLQERHDNILQFICSSEDGLIGTLHGAIAPMATDFGVVSI